MSGGGVVWVWSLVIGMGLVCLLCFWWVWLGIWCVCGVDCVAIAVFGYWWVGCVRLVVE